MANSPESIASHPTDFTSILNDYEHRIGFATRVIAAHLPYLLPALPPDPIIHDNACGIGAVTNKLIQTLPTARIYATDPVPPIIQTFRSVLAKKEAWQKNIIEVAVMDSQELRYQDNFFDVDIMNFGIYFFADPVRGARELCRTLKPGGTAIVTVWREFGFKQILWEVQRRVKPMNPLTELPLMEPWCNGERLRKTMEEAGFSGVEMKVIKDRTWSIGMRDFQSVLLENFAAMVARNWNEEEKARLAPMTAAVLDDSEAKFCVRDGDRIGVPMVAWAAVCTKPSV